MALCSPQLQKFILNRVCCKYGFDDTTKKSITLKGRPRKKISCSAIAIDASSSLESVSGIRWGSVKLKGARDEMEDDVVIIQSDELDGFAYAAVFDGHAGFSSVKFLRDELYKECVSALQGGKLLNSKDSNAIKKALEEAFKNADAKLLKWLDAKGEDDESGTTATAMFIKKDMVFIPHVGDSCVALSRGGKAEVVTESHRPYGNKQASLKEIRRIREAGGWINDGRICGDISVSRSFGDIRFKTRKNEMVKKGIEERRWSEKFASRIQFKDDLVTAFPDVYQVALGSDAEFVLLASDGLWDYIKSSEAVNFIRNHLRQYGDVQMASDALAQLALNRRSQDNISIIVADLGRTDWKRLPEQQQNFVFELGQAVATVSVVSFGIWMSCQFSF